MMCSRAFFEENKMTKGACYKSDYNRCGNNDLNVRIKERADVQAYKENASKDACGAKF